MHTRCKGFASGLFLRFVHAASDVKFVDVLSVEPDDRQINDERALLIRPDEVSSCIPNPAVLEIAHPTIRCLFEHFHMIVCGFAWFGFCGLLVHACP